MNSDREINRTFYDLIYDNDICVQGVCESFNDFRCSILKIIVLKIRALMETLNKNLVLS